MKIICITTCLLGISFFSLAQEPVKPSVEVIVSDTIELPITEWTYTVNVTGIVNYEPYPISTDTAALNRYYDKLDEKTGKSQDSLYAIVAEKAKSFGKITSNNFNNYYDTYYDKNKKHQLIIVFNTENKLQQFHDWLKDIAGTSGYVTKFSNEKSISEAAKATLLTRLIQKAKEEAMILAKLSKRTLGNIVQVSENIMDGYLLNANYYKENSANKYTTVTKSMKVKFEWY